MEIVILLKAFIVLIVIIFLIILTTKVIKNFYKFGNYAINYNKKEITIKEILYIDPTTRVINIARGKKHYLLMIGKSNERLIDIYDEE